MCFLVSVDISSFGIGDSKDQACFFFLENFDGFEDFYWTIFDCISFCCGSLFLWNSCVQTCYLPLDQAAKQPPWLPLYTR